MTTEVIVRPEQALAAQFADQSKLQLLQDTVMPPNSTLDEFDLFVTVCKHVALDPWVKQIYPMKTGGKNPKMSIVVGIDGFRLIAQRSGQYDGQDGPYWCGKDGIWRDVWVASEPPVAAKMVVFRKDASRGFTGIANFDAYVQTSKNWDTGQVGPNPMWQKMGANQLAKCAEALALRKGFPAEMSGIYTEDEMAQADNPAHDAPEPVSPARRDAREALRSGGASAETRAQQREQAKQHTNAPPDDPAVAEPESDKHMKMIAALPEWMAPLYAVLVDQNRKLSELSVILNRPASAKALRDWAAQLPEDVDPYGEMLRLCREHDIIPKPRQESLTDWAPVDAVDPETGEVVTVEGEVMPEGFVPVDEEDAVFE